MSSPSRSASVRFDSRATGYENDILNPHQVPTRQPSRRERKNNHAHDERRQTPRGSAWASHGALSLAGRDCPALSRVDRWDLASTLKDQWHRARSGNRARLSFEIAPAIIYPRAPVGVSAASFADHSGQGVRYVFSPYPPISSVFLIHTLRLLRCNGVYYAGAQAHTSAGTHPCEPMVRRWNTVVTVTTVAIRINRVEFRGSRSGPRGSAPTIKESL